ncbi:MAG: c-type cytochrome [Acidobacteria bacterium]|nr:c-type cytochrome [Acidobacteriota bacterium]
MPPVPSGLRRIGLCAAGILMLGLAAGLAQTPPPVPQDDVQRLYDRSCASCHGSDGKGRGPAADALTPAPRDFTRGMYKFRSTQSGSIPSDDDLDRAIAGGMPGTAMPAWKGMLTDSQITALVGYVKHFSPRFATDQPAPIKASQPVPPTPDSIDKGKAAFGALACGACHGDNGTGAGAVTAGMKDDWGNDIKAAVLNEPWTFRGGSTATDIYLRIKTGIDGTPMPSFADTASDQDIWNVANYVVSIARKPAWAMTADELKAFYEQQRKQDADDLVGRGRYLVDTMACAHCHSPVDRDGRVLPGLKYAGGQKMRLVVWGDVVSANLTSDNETGIGRYSDADLKRAMTRGIKRDESRMLPFPMDWPSFAHLSEQDQNAIVAFLRTIPPVKNQIPPPARPGVVAYLASKFQMLIGGKDYPIVIFEGNAGSAGSQGGNPAAAAR